MFNCRSRIRIVLFASILLSVVASVSSEESTYQRPPDHIADLIDAPPSPSVLISPDRNWMLLRHRPGMKTIAEVAAPEVRLGGVRINARNNGPSRTRYYNGFSIQRLPDGQATIVTGLPPVAQLGSVRWSPNSEWVTFTQSFEDRIELWGFELDNPVARPLTDKALNDAYGSAYRWLSDSKTLIINALIAERPEQPVEPMVPTGPNIQENLGQKSPARTYQDLLKNGYDEALFDHLLTAQLIRITIDGASALIGSPGIIYSADPSPNAKHLLVKQLHKPYSYTVPAYRFPLLTEVWDIDGNVVSEVADLPLADQIPIAFGSVRTGRRSISWRADAPATLSWVEALDGGDAGAEAELRDGVYLQKAPFDSDPIPLLKLALRYEDILWGDGDLALASEGWWKTRMVRTWRIWPDKPGREPQLIEERSWQDRYSDPGQPLMINNTYGQRVLLSDKSGRRLFLTGAGASPEGDRPFLDALDLKTKKTERLFHSEAPYYERPVAFLNVKKRQILTSREAVDQPPNYFVRDLAKGDLSQLTEFPHPMPELATVKKELITYSRDDGVKLSAELFLPPGYEPDDGPLPLIVWAYPREYKDKAAASQIQGSPYRFVRVGWWSPLLWLVHGYAVLDHPTMPIVAEGDVEPNDTFIEQLVSSSQAAINEAVRRGVADPDRVAIGGHSYGAFMTANLLAHSDLFRAGIARSGAYNRTLTPFGFQSEERTVWEAPEIYFAMSPFLHAEKVDEPILLIHGEADNNSGTYPLQSERYYGALKGMGATVRLCMLPAESHSYRARESIMHMAWEMTEWLDKYVKNAQPRELLKTRQETGQSN